MTAEVRALVVHGAHDLRLESLAAQPLGEHSVELRTVVGGICGSDLHYYNEGGVGDFTIREPLVLGHEIAGVVQRVGDLVTSAEPGERVVVDPSVPCGVCAQCQRGRRNLCTDVRFLGSAARMPHSQGGFRERLVVDGTQCVQVPDHLSFAHAVFAEPLSVATHAVGRAGPMLGRHILITGAGPIGLLILLVALHAGAERVTVTDICEAPLRVAAQLGASAAVNVADGGEVPDADIAFEASGATAGLQTCIDSIGPGGRVVMVGLLAPGHVPVPGNRIVTREFELAGSFRFTNEEFRAAVGMLATGLDVSPLLSGRFQLGDSLEAFETAGRRDSSVKVQIEFAPGESAHGSPGSPVKSAAGT